jgi:hypothetical protein
MPPNPLITRHLSTDNSRSCYNTLHPVDPLIKGAPSICSASSICSAQCFPDPQEYHYTYIRLSRCSKKSTLPQQSRRHEVGNTFGTACWSLRFYLHRKAKLGVSSLLMWQPLPTRVFIQHKNGSGPPNVEHSLTWCSHPQTYWRFYTFGVVRHNLA